MSINNKQIDPLIDNLKIDLGTRITYILDILGLNKSTFMQLIQTTEPTIKKVLLGNGSYNIDLVLNSCFIFGMTVSELTNLNFLLPIDFREHLIRYHKKVNSSVYYNLKAYTPPSDYAIKRLLQTDFLLNPKKAGEISDEIEKLLGVKYEASTLNTPMQNFKSIMRWNEAKDNKGHFTYQIKKHTYTNHQQNTQLPTFIQLSNSIESITSTESVYSIFSILSRLAIGAESDKVLIRSTTNHSFNKNSINRFILPLVESNLIVALPTSHEKKDTFYKITHLGLKKLNYPKD